MTTDNAVVLDAIVSSKIPRSTMEALRAEATRTGRSISHQVREVLCAWADGVR